MDSTTASVTSPAAVEASDIIQYLERRQWVINPGVEEKAFRYLLGGISFLALMDVLTTVKANGSPIRAAGLYRLWLEQTPETAPLRYAGWFNLGVELAGLGDHAGAALAYQNALQLKPDLHVAAINLGLIHETLGQTDKALETWRGAVQPDDVRIGILNQRGRLLETLGRFDEAEQELYRSLLTVPQQADAFSHWLYLRMKMCMWPVLGAPIPGLNFEDMVTKAGGLSTLALFDDNITVNSWVARWLERKMPPAPIRLSPEQGYTHQKIRIGYLSSDYCLHPISMLIAEMLEKHDRDHFEVYGYCSSREDGSPLRARVVAAFDKFVRVAGLSDEQAARLIRADEIDILIDLNGLTDGTRLGALRWRPAPVQLTYLGFVGSLPVPELDYAIADHYVVPPELAENFHPKPLYMPRCYQVNDTKTVIGPPEKRADLGLPNDKFVYCCFSNTYKITEEIFDAWMQILLQTKNSVLWVLARTKWARENMQARARRWGVSLDRLIFAEPTSPHAYLSRLALADLFLDTYPYNSGTTASDALRMGLPMITLSGQTFSSRMAGSLLNVMGLGEGIATSFESYIALAVALGNDPVRYQQFRHALSGDVWRQTLGNIDLFMPELEERYRAIRKQPQPAG